VVPPSANLRTGAGLSLGSPGQPDQSDGPPWDDQHVPGEEHGEGEGVMETRGRGSDGKERERE